MSDFGPRPGAVQVILRVGDDVGLLGFAANGREVVALLRIAADELERSVEHLDGAHRNGHKP
jgi:hypothetical protein